MTRTILNLLNGWLGFRVVAFPDRKASVKKRRQNLHRQLAEELGREWKVR